MKVGSQTRIPVSCVESIQAAFRVEKRDVAPETKELRRPGFCTV